MYNPPDLLTQHLQFTPSSVWLTLAILLSPNAGAYFGWCTKNSLLWMSDMTSVRESKRVPIPHKWTVVSGIILLWPWCCSLLQRKQSLVYNWYSCTWLLSERQQCETFYCINNRTFNSKIKGKRYTFFFPRYCIKCKRLTCPASSPTTFKQMFVIDYKLLMWLLSHFHVVSTYYWPRRYFNIPCILVCSFKG